MAPSAVVAAELVGSEVSAWMRIPDARIPEDWPDAFREHAGGFPHRAKGFDRDGAIAFSWTDGSAAPRIFLVKFFQEPPTDPGQLLLEIPGGIPADKPVSVAHGPMGGE